MGVQGKLTQDTVGPTFQVSQITNLGAVLGNLPFSDLIKVVSSTSLSKAKNATLATPNDYLLGVSKEKLQPGLTPRGLD